MKRSEINAAIQLALNTLNEHKFSLPPFAHWTAEQWTSVGQKSKRIRLNGLGWDITDFGSGKFDTIGAVLFTLRNGNVDQPSEGTLYAEKVIVLKPGQYIPFHFHWVKTEDIINRGGGVLCVQLFNALPDDSVDNANPVEVFCDAVRRVVQPGEVISLQPGESITLTPRLYHNLLAAEDSGVLICGEVSSVNDDSVDNRFAEPTSRFADIDEDQSPLRLLCNEYPKIQGQP